MTSALGMNTVLAAKNSLYFNSCSQIVLYVLTLFSATFGPKSSTQIILVILLQRVQLIDGLPNKGSQPFP